MVHPVYLVKISPSIYRDLHALRYTAVNRIGDSDMKTVFNVWL